MQEAALSRALASDEGVRDSLALAGALETARTTAESSAFEGNVTLSASLAFLSTLFAHRRLRDSLRSGVRVTDDSAWYPTGAPARVDDELVRRGARLAVERFDIDPSRLSERCEVAVAEILREK
ncbi:hypothetical protein ACFQJC_00010 [Haloferax namakaokahaiae]|uniref:Uncharacterized protein n=1 Tax=Haloferax namakaokahaiae TaxID=1748331 RepID=A0ABD5Z9P9_9EURY